ncbi:hydantoinase B/oxoprolinase family protein [Sciscionella sediminilitoris]|uniref:hydantoinase B/oxoprolinase family protein n=1 Tax=Sciscionella sediminilitoris TaxID=1445613 RepID=UPI0004DF71BF|nr:hydantoinase B/oxoprolinase family protein [Sciscionella sp. SE31]
MTGHASDADRRDTIALEILRTRLMACAEELAAVLARSAPTVEVSQAREFTVAICDASGQVVALDNALELASIQATVSHAIGYFEFDISEGDVVLTNDPFTGGTRVQDITLVAPHIVDSEVLGLIAVRTRIRDIGGQIGGNINPEATELLAEGVPVTPVKIQRLGRPVRDVVAAFLLNGRRPGETHRTVTAAMAVLEMGIGRCAELVAGHGVELVRRSFRYAQDYSEQIARTLIRGWRAGRYAGQHELDLADGDSPVVIRLDAEITDSAVILDFSASDAQSGQFINSPASVTASCAMQAILVSLGGTLPPNGGLLRVVEVRTRPGTIVDPVRPAAVGWGAHHPGSEVTDVVTATLRSALPHPAPALSVPRPAVFYRPSGDRSVQIDLGRWAIGGASATTETDGWGRPALAARGELPSIEQWESEQHPGIERFEYAEDSAGSGAHAGAPAVEATFALPAGLLFTLWSRSMHTPTAGTDGGTPGNPGSVEFETPDGWQQAPLVAAEAPIPATRLRIRLSGGGGQGDPRAREHSAVLADVDDGLISSTTATEVYRLEGRASDG